jgi:hypothetical protein
MVGKKIKLARKTSHFNLELGSGEAISSLDQSDCFIASFLAMTARGIFCETIIF